MSVSLTKDGNHEFAKMKVVEVDEGKYVDGETPHCRSQMSQSSKAVKSVLMD